MSVELFKKYYVNDVALSEEKQDILRKILTMLEYFPSTGETLRQKYAAAAAEMGLNALSGYILQQYRYEAFLAAAQKERLERFKHNPQLFLTDERYLAVEKKFQISNNNYLAEKQKITQKYEREQAQLRARESGELVTLERQYKDKLKEIEVEKKEILHQIKLENDPDYAAAYYAEQKRKQEEKERLEKERLFLYLFGLRGIADTDRGKLLPILRKLDIGERLSEQDVAWLTTKGKHYFAKDGKIYRMYHRIEAQYQQQLFEKNKGIWHAVNASSHLRKAGAAKEAEHFLSPISPRKIADKKIKSAFLTTFGGVKRDLGDFAAGVEMAKEAHTSLPKDYCPCTLLGALYFELKKYATGTEWFTMAERLGAPQDKADAEIKAIYAKANKAGKEQLKAYLLALDAKRYAWLNKPERKRGQSRDA